MNGQCGYEILPTATRLTGKVVASGNQLEWTSENEKDIPEYILERRKSGSIGFAPIANLPAKKAVNTSANKYLFTDNNAQEESYDYRLRIKLRNGKTEYSNIVHLKEEVNYITVYPNPVQDLLHISIAGNKAANYRIELFNQHGQLIQTPELSNITRTIWQFRRSGNLPAGIYLAKVMNTTGILKTFKLIFQ
ncbi:MAG: T9SS type A sorting domain-containing protein [Flavisolibacter sp.]|nr:T9SS type A sorting domain-containing protein [Flavisolibacter sp.]